MNQLKPHSRVRHRNKTLKSPTPTAQEKIHGLCKVAMGMVQSGESTVKEGDLVETEQCRGPRRNLRVQM